MATRTYEKSPPTILLVVLFAFLQIGAKKCEDEEEGQKPDIPLKPLTDTGGSTDEAKDQGSDSGKPPQKKEDESNAPKDDSKENPTAEKPEEADSKKPEADTDTAGEPSGTDTEISWEEDQEREHGVDVFLVDPNEMDEALEILEYGDLFEFSAYIARWKKKPIIVDSRVLDIEASVHLPPSTPPREVQVALLSLLRMNGFTLIDLGDHLEILPVDEAKSKVLPKRNKKLPPGDEIVAIVHPIKNGSASEVAKALENFKSPDGQIVPFEPTNTLFITDYSSSMKRLRRMLWVLDKPEKQSDADGDTDKDDGPDGPCEIAAVAPDEDKPWTPAEADFALCGCVPKTPDIVYGFSPTNAEPMAIDSSLFTRIGYTPISFNEESDFLTLLDQDESMDQVLTATAREFFNSARRHKSKVDLVVTKNDWCDSKCNCEAECSTKTRYQLRNVVTAVNKLLKATLDDWYNGVVETSRLGDSIPTFGNGVTIRFECFPKDPCAEKAYIKMIKELKYSLRSWERASGRAMMLNIAFQHTELGKGAYKFENLESYIYEDKNDPEVRLLIGLGEDTSAEKKALRASIEDEYKGDVRRTVLRHTIPVLPFEGTCGDKINKAQMIDDLIYFHDNFGGVGFPCLNVATENADPDIVKQLVKEFQGDQEADAVKKWIVDFAPDLSGTVCALRWEIRIAANLLIIFQAVFTLLCVWYYRLREFRKRHRKIFIGLAAFTVLLWFCLILFDPFWTQYVMVVIIAAMVLLVAALFLMTLSVQRRRNYP